MMSEIQPRRHVLLESLIDHVLVSGLGAASLRPLAKAVGTSDRMLLYYFPDKAALLRAILGGIAGRLMRLLEQNRSADRLSPDEFQARMIPLVFNDAIWPYMQLGLELAGFAVRGDPVFRDVGEQIVRGFLAWTGEQISVPDDAMTETIATQLLIAIEGAVMLKSLGLGREVHASIAAID
jgi:AcrR family transcriptional regulator